jgi:hypothetical protein
MDTPDRTLAASMLLQAKQDLLAWKPTLRGKERDKARKAFGSAVEWIWAPAESHALDFVTTCWKIGVDADLMKEKLFSRMSEWQREQAESHLDGKKRAA